MKNVCLTQEEFKTEYEYGLLSEPKFFTQPASWPVQSIAISRNVRLSVCVLSPPKNVLTVGSGDFWSKTTMVKTAKTTTRIFFFFFYTGAIISTL